MFAISTVWNAWRHKDAASMVDELTGLGFGSLELSFGLPLQMVEEIGTLVRAGTISISSLHNYCPAPLLPEGTSLSHDALPLSSLDERERRWAVRQTVRAIEIASSLKAPAVVLHLGKVPISPLSPKLMALAENRETQTGRYQRLKAKLQKKREARKQPYLEQAATSLRELVGRAEELGVRLGIENRYYPEEIPSLEEIGPLIERAGSPAVGYWHDLGHAAVKENIGWEPRDEYLKRYGKYLIGIHIHDVILTRDHKAPLQGELDYEELGDLLRQDVLKVLEVHPAATAEEIRNGLGCLRRVIQTPRNGSAESLQ
ncbi:MAG: sugar phosphate isomerase/epimerase family protein [PVC group bacterium]